MSDQVKALGRVEQQAVEGVSRLNALRKKISALGTTKKDSVEADGCDADDRSTGITGNGRAKPPTTRAGRKSDIRIDDIGDELGPQNMSETVSQ